MNRFEQGDVVHVHMKRGSNLVVCNPVTIIQTPVYGDATWQIRDASGIRFAINTNSSSFEGLEEYKRKEDDNGPPI